MSNHQSFNNARLPTSKHVTNLLRDESGIFGIGADVWLRQRVAYSATVASSLAAAWLAGKLGLAAFWVVVVVAVLSMFASTRKVNIPRRSAGLWNDLWSAALTVFDCRPMTLSTDRTEVTWFTASLIGSRPDVQPSWVRFPDVERAEWLNKIVDCLWPHVDKYLARAVRPEIESRINAVLPAILSPFEFRSFTIGSVPPRIGGVKVYTENVRRDEMILEFDLMVFTESEIAASVAGLTFGVSDIQVNGTLRLTGRLVDRMPIIGSVDVSFLDPPGVVRILVAEAKELREVGSGFFRRGLCDAFCKIHVGNNGFRTPTISRTVRPAWNHYVEAAVYDTDYQSILIEAYDENRSANTPIGCATVHLTEVRRNEHVDQWFRLEGAKMGAVRICAWWLSLNDDVSELLSQQKTLSKKIGAEPNPRAWLRVGRNEQKTSMKKDTNNPKWNETFVFLIHNIHTEYLEIEVFDGDSGVSRTGGASVNSALDRHSLGQLRLHFCRLLLPQTATSSSAAVADDERATSSPISSVIDQPFALHESGPESSITLRLQFAALSVGAIRPHDGATIAASVVAAAETDQTLACDSPLHVSTTNASEDTDDVIEELSHVTTQLMTARNVDRSASSEDLSGKIGRRPEGAFVQLSIQHVTDLSQLTLVVHRCTGLPTRVRGMTRLSGVSVRVTMYNQQPLNAWSRQKTKTVKNVHNPEFEESLTWPIQATDLQDGVLKVEIQAILAAGPWRIITARRTSLGSANIWLSELANIQDGSTSWYELQTSAGIQRGRSVVSLT